MKVTITKPDGTTEEVELDELVKRSGGATISAVVHRADGTTEDLGEIAHVDSTWGAE